MPLSSYYTGTRCFWLAFICGMIDVFFMAFLVHGLRCDGFYATMSEMVNPLTVGGILLGGLLMGFLITMESSMIVAFAMQIFFMVLTFIGVFLSFVDIERSTIMALLSDRSLGILSGLLAVIDLLPNGRIVLAYVVFYGLIAYLAMFAVTIKMRRLECAWGRLSGAALCATVLFISLFFISVANNLVVRSGTVSAGDIVEETLIQNRFLITPVGDIQLLSESEIEALENEVHSGDISTTPVQ